MRTLLYLIRKEALLLVRDWHALVLLFVMPAVFILIMSLALQNRFSAQSGVHIKYYLLNRDAGAADADLLKGLQGLNGFGALPATAAEPELKARVRRGEARFLLVVPRGFTAALASDNPVPLRMTATPDASAAVYRLFQSSVREVLARVYLKQVMHALSDQRGKDAPPLPAIGLDEVDRLLVSESLYSRGGKTVFPSSVQQNVPAWLLFAMFFIAIPLSTTWVRERQQGTYMRLRSMGIGAMTLLAGKLVPYLGVNLLQVVAMLLVGVFVVPWFGGDALTLGHSWPALALMAVVASFAAVAYALLVANLVTTSEQATIFTGVANLLMAALGGIMVPRFVMPQALQAVSHYSPMAWGLDGFLDVFLRDGGLGLVAGPALELFVFGTACLVVTGLFMGWRRRR